MKRWGIITLAVVFYVSFGLFLLGACGGGGGGNGDGPQIPAAPTELLVNTTTLDSVTISWTDNATDETGFYVERGTAAVGPFTTVATLGQDEETYTQSTLISGRYYFYRVCAYNTDGDSPFSDVVLATTELGPGGGYPIPALADSLSTLTVFENDSSGYWTASIDYIDPGTDSAWGTSDDEIDTYCIPTRNPDHTIDFSECVHYIAGMPIELYNTYAYNSTGNLIQRERYNDPGGDTIWGTGDDQMYRYEQHFYDSSDRKTGEMRINGVGVDGIWFTPDDVVGQIYTYTYDADGYRNMRIQFRDPGIDLDWFTNDDVIHNYYTYHRRPDGQVSRRFTFNDGIDGIWFNDDDEITQHEVDVHDSNGYKLGEYYYGGPGTDGVWFQ
jgi:hypothetical protein